MILGTRWGAELLKVSFLVKWNALATRTVQAFEVTEWIIPTRPASLASVTKLCWNTRGKKGNRAPYQTVKAKHRSWKASLMLSKEAFISLCSGRADGAEQQTDDLMGSSNPILYHPSTLPPVFSIDTRPVSKSGRLSQPSLAPYSISFMVLPQ